LGETADHDRGDAEVGDSCEKDEAARGEAAYQTMIEPRRRRFGRLNGDDSITVRWRQD
jgi:hypothetical protein